MCAWNELSDFGMRWSCNSHISFGLLALLNMRFGIWFLFILWKSLRIELLGIFFVFIWWNFLWGYLVVSWKALHLKGENFISVRNFCFGWGKNTPCIRYMSPPSHTLVGFTPCECIWCMMYLLLVEGMTQRIGTFFSFSFFPLFSTSKELIYAFIICFLYDQYFTFIAFLYIKTLELGKGYIHASCL